MKLTTIDAIKEVERKLNDLDAEFDNSNDEDALEWAVAYGKLNVLIEHLKTGLLDIVIKQSKK